MFKCTFHTHSRFDDGEGELEAHIQSAISKNFKIFGFSAHAPVNIDTTWNMKQENLAEYINTASVLKEKYKGQIEIYTGLETDYYPGCTDWRNKKGIDYTIGAVHFLKDEKSGCYLPMDGDAQEFANAINDGFDGKAEALVCTYYSHIREMLLRMTPNIVAHLDVIRKNNYGNKFFDTSDDWYRDEVLKTLEIISLTHTIVEVNTGGIARGYLKDPYPEVWILEKCLEMDIPIMVNSDSHSPENIEFYFDEAYSLLRDLGFKYQRILYEDTWRDIRI